MSKYVLMDVSEVTKVFPSKSQPMANGVRRDILKATLLCEGDEYTLEVDDGVDIPVGWAGQAFCYGKPVKYVSKFNNDSSSRFAVVPTGVFKFKPLRPVKNDFDSFMSAKSNTTLSGSEPPAGATALGLPRMNSK